MSMDPITAIADLGSTLVDKFWPDKTDENAVKGQQLLVELTSRYSAITTEANSQDRWTSRARPSFMYVIYVLILAAIPYGLAHVIAPELAGRFAAGFGIWLREIPDQLWWLFGSGYLGYGALRSMDKMTRAKTGKGVAAKFGLH